jgi:DNA repair exonuclease SbcCD nuclease subunit
MFKFLHAADIHLDSPLLGLERYEGAPVDEIRGATRRAFENLVQMAIREAVDFVLIAGDLYDGDWKDAGTGLYFVKQMARLRQVNIPVFLIAGNHDAENKMTRELRFPDNVKVFSSRRAETVKHPTLAVAIHGQSYLTADVKDNLAEEYPKPVLEAFNIGLLHTCVAGAAGHAPYAPCTVAQLTGKGYQYWALGHVHTAQVLSEDPPIIFPGNVQGRHIGETGARGCLLVHVDERQQVTREFVALDVMRWSVCEVDASGAEDLAAVLDRFMERLRGLLREHAGLPLAIRVRVSGATGAHRSLAAERMAVREKMMAVALDASNGSVWIERVVIDTRPENSTVLPEGPLTELKSYLDVLRTNAEEFNALRGEIAALRDFLPADIQEEFDFGDRQSLLSDVEALLMERLK